MSDIGITINVHVSTDTNVSCERWMDRNRDLYLLELEAGRQSITIFIPASEMARVLAAFGNPVVTRPPAPVIDTEHHQ